MTEPRPAVLVRGRIDKTLVIDTLLPPDPGKYSWAGHLGARMQQPVVEEIARSGTTLVFTNVRSQAEIWYQLLLEARPEWAGEIALHHGSLDRATREWVEQGLKDGTLSAVVATSSLDLGVDFLPVERVLQIGSAKGVARMMQRAGRSGHAPGRASRVTLVPTNTMELIEAAAARRAAPAGRVEQRDAPDKPLDVLVQHLVTVALGGGFRADALFDEVRTAVVLPRAHARRVRLGAGLLRARRREPRRLSRLPPHRARRGRHLPRAATAASPSATGCGIGTIVSDASMQVKYLARRQHRHHRGGLHRAAAQGRLLLLRRPLLEFVRVQDMAAYVRKATRSKGTVPTWQGSKMALSDRAGRRGAGDDAAAAQGDFFEPELRGRAADAANAGAPVAHPDARHAAGRSVSSRARATTFTSIPFAGRHVHLGLASLLAWRLARERPNTFSMSVNDYGFELVGAGRFDLAPVLDGACSRRATCCTTCWPRSIPPSWRSGASARSRAWPAWCSPAIPAQPKSTQQLQASSGLFFEVFRKYDNGNLLLGQAEHEVLSQELEISRLRATLDAHAAQRCVLVELRHPSPLSLPLMVERFREQLTTEKLSSRLDRILRDMERDAAGA